MQCTELGAYTRLALEVETAEGAELVLADGRRVLDLYGGHCVNTLGAADAGLGRCIDEQWHRLSFTTNLIDHDARGEFLAAFEANLPFVDGGWQVFCSNSGAEANENALKAALAATGRERVITFTGAFHGRTAAASAVSDLRRPAFPRAPFDVVRLPWGATEAAVQAIDETVGAVLLEPIQSLAGVREPPRGFLAALRDACNTHGSLLVFDEVQTGNGRLGVPWASQHFGVVPDLFTTAKGAAGGLPIGLTVQRAQLEKDLPRGLFGSTFGGGPLVLSAAAEVARRIAAPGFAENVRATSHALRAAAFEGPVESVRGAGLLLGLVLDQGFLAADVRDALLARGVLTGTSNDPRVLRLSPPLIVGPEHAPRFAAAFEALTVGAKPTQDMQ